MLKKAPGFFSVEFLQKSIQGKSFFSKPLYTSLLVLFLALKNFSKHKCSLRASSLTFYLLMSIVPFFSLFLGIAKGFGYHEYLEKEILERFDKSEEVLTKIIQYANNMLSSAKEGVIAAFAILFLFWSVIKLLSHIEGALNSIWEVHELRSWKVRLSNYLAMILIFPLFFIVYIGLKALLMDFYQVEALETLKELFFYYSIKLGSYVLVFALFGFVYVFMTQPKVNFFPAMMAGIVAGGSFLILKWAYVHFQVTINQYNAIYGSLAALPFFLIWVQLNFLIFLFGAEVCLALQHLKKIKGS